MPHDFIPRDSIDRLIADRLPVWLTTADVDQIRALHRALRREQAMAVQVGNHFRPLPSIDAFAEPLLTQALRTIGVAEPDVRRMTVHIEQVIELPSAAPKLLVNRQTYRSQRSLLASALHNFHEEELRPGLQRRAWLADADGQRLALGFEEFAHCCRTLDLGGQYQRLLTSLLSPKARPPAPADAAVKAVERMLEDNMRAQLEVAVRQARLRGKLAAYAFYRLLPLWTEAPVVPPVPGSATPRQLYLLGKCIRGVVTFEQRDVPDGAIQSITAWIPQDPSSSVSQHASWEALYQWLGKRLRSERYRTFFARFISERDRPAFTETLLRLHEATERGTPLQLDGRHFAIDGPLFGYLCTLHTRKMLDDARVLAVPTGDEDLASRHARLQASINAGLNLLNLAALFVPGLGEVMFAVSAVQIAAQVYEGYQDWRLGDRQGALEHLFGVAECLALGTATSALGWAALHGLPRFAFVDALTPVLDAEGQVRLTHGKPPIQTVADTGELVRRLGGPFADTPDWQAEALLQVTDLTPAQLRRLHVEHAGPLARVHDMHERMALHTRLPSLRGASFDTELMSRQAPATALQAPLIRAFPSLSRRQTQELLDHASSAEVEALQATGRIPLSLAERARWAARDARLDRACLGLQLAQAVNADTERLALGLLEQSAPWPSGVRVELREHDYDGPVVVATGNTLAPEVRVIVRRNEGYVALPAHPIRQGAAGNSLWQALLLSLDPTQKRLLSGAEPGEDAQADLDEAGLRQWLADQAGQDRQRCADLLGMAPVGTGLRPPRRLADGRLGYPLSGRLPGSRQAIRSGIHQLFPLLDDAQLETYIADLLDRNVDLWQHYGDLRETLARLRHALTLWRSEAGLIVSLRRRRVATQLRRCWRRKLVDYAGDYVLEIDGERVGNLPQLPTSVDFSHVRRLALRNMKLNEIDEDFLRRFSQVTELDLQGNRLTQVPAGIEHLGRLRRLHLQHNEIVMTPEGNRRLSALQHLQWLDLSRNPLGQAPTLTELSRLTHLRLRNTGLEHLPPVQALPWRAHVDMRENRIQQLRQELHGLWQRVSLHDNPLDPASVQLLDALHDTDAPRTRASASYRHSAIDDALLERWIGLPSAAEHGRRVQVWRELHEQENAGDLFRFLADFADTEDFEQQPDHYRDRVWHMLESAHAHQALRTRLFETAAGDRTCEDRLLLIMAQLELSVLVERAVIDGPAEFVEARLLGLERSLFRMDVLDGIATRHIERLYNAHVPLVDEIEVRLYYRVKLRNVLGLPATPNAMHYEHFAQVTSRDLRRAADEVLAAENPEALAASLAERPFWQHFVRERYAQRFEALSAPFYERLEALESGTPDSGQWLEASNRLKEELEGAERALMRTLADEAYARAAQR
ncbi:NEL-type E3 ubiquitin ligase domain-containing protein [Pseudomonas alabamensis]|uniref:NEL-type E3 ubiquitin ligase domain-containing protein n=1 Tax=Pseudomonas alabamensis TaxID=3064349 RepID=UPI000745C7A7|nr:hypothetical protein APT63_15820 [Pseudomonas monteilii]